jgi:hypothetical protein
MAEFEGFLCWTPEDAADLPTEAVVASRAFFFATHAPLKIHRSDPNGRLQDARDLVNEEAVRSDFLNRRLSGGVLLMPVIGESGTGKSHLVRWIREKTPSTVARQVIYLPKSQTSLKAVVKALLAEVKSAALDQLRDDVDRMSSGLDQSGLEQRLVNQLQEALVAAPMETGAARVLSGKKGLPVLLLDPHVRDHLLRSGALIPQMAKSILNDRGKNEKDRPLEFTTEDLPLDILDVKQAAADTQKMLQLLGARPELQGAAVRMLNAQVEFAVANATTIGAGRLQNAMIEVRREFSRQGKEIVLLIEDFAVIQGFQRDLLDALIEVADRDGRSDLAPIRTLMAVTSGYYGSLPDTVLTRVRAATGYIYDLDAQFDPHVGMSETSSFVGRYLNAARLGQEELEKHGAQEDIPVLNACDICDFRKQCHEAFGRSGEGHGLYPFNESTLRRAIRARPAPGVIGAFNPRVVIGEVVRNVLVEHAAAIGEKVFPDKRFAEEYRARRPGEVGYSSDMREEMLSSAVSEALEEAFEPAEATRYATFLEFWGDARDHLDTLSPVLFKAFGLKPVDMTGIDTGIQGQEEDEKKRGDTKGAGHGPGDPGSLTPSALKKIEQVEDWLTRRAVLDLGLAREIREIVRNAVLQRCAWNEPLMREPTSDQLKRAWPVGAAGVSIEGAYGEGKEPPVNAAIRFARSPANAVFFQGLLRAKYGDSIGGARAMRRLARYSEHYQGYLQQAVVRSAAVTDEQLAIGVRAALIGATLAGKAVPNMSEADLLDVVFDDGRNWSRGDTATCDDKWLARLQVHLTARPELVGNLRSGFGVTQGQGGVRMIDAARALPILRAAVKSWEWSMPGTELALWTKKAVERFSEWDSLLDLQLSALSGQLAGVRQFLPKGTSLADTIEAVNAAALDAREAGADQMAPEKYMQLQDLIAQARQQDWRAVERLESDLARANESDQRDRARIIAAARDRGKDIDVIRRFLVASDEWLTNALKAARMRQSGAQQAAEAQVRELLSYWAAIGGESQG